MGKVIFERSWRYVVEAGDHTDVLIPIRYFDDPDKAHAYMNDLNTVRFAHVVDLGEQ